MRARTARVRLTALFISCSVPVVAAAQEHVPTIVNAKSVVGDKTSAKIINGKLTFWYPTVGALLYRNANTPFGSWCTATLIGCNTVLTAAHCVAEDRETKNYKVFFQHAGLFDLAGKIQMQDDKYQAPGGNGSRADVAVLTLSKSIDGIAPDHINDDREHAAELDGTIVGYGITNGNKLDYGLKRFGFVVAGACDASKTGKDLVCWNFVNNRASDTCSGDSGGPLFLSKGRPSPVVSGVTSGGNVSCQAPDNAFDASVFRNSNWIKSAVGSDLAPAACGGLALLEDKESRYRGFSGQINDRSPKQVFEVELKDVKQFRVEANLGKPANIEPDQIVTRPRLLLTKAAGGGIVTCPEVEAQAASCSLDNPADGVYTIVLTRGGEKGIADFQLTVSVF